MIGKVYTTHFEIEPRQHEILGLDLGEGPKRRDMLLVMAVIALWVLIWYPLLGFPSKYTFSIYILPPSILAIFGLRPSKKCRRRRVLTDWVLGITYAISGSRPIIRMGARRATSMEMPPLNQRWHILAGVSHLIAPQKAPWDAPETSKSEIKPTGRPQRVEIRLPFIGTEKLREKLTK